MFSSCLQTFLVSYLFHPKYNGTLTSVDYVFCNQGNVVSHFECMIDVINGTKKVHDLKVNIGGGKSLQAFLHLFTALD